MIFGEQFFITFSGNIFVNYLATQQKIHWHFCPFGQQQSRGSYLTSPSDESSNVDNRKISWYFGRRLEVVTEPVKASIRHCHSTLIRVYSTEGEIFCWDALGELDGYHEIESLQQRQGFQFSV